MKIKTIGTGSLGNAYILTTSEGKHLLLDAGLPIQEIKVGLDFDIGNLEGCIVTHCHIDHSKSAGKLETMGIRVFRPYTIDKTILKTQIGSFAVTSFPVPHNGTPNRAFIIKADGEKVCYITDAEFCPYNLRKENFTAMLVECNYDSRIIDSNAPNYEHSCLGHMELQTCKSFISDNSNFDYLKKIILIHMSNKNLNNEVALNEIKSIVENDVEVSLAHPGLELEV